MGDRAVSEVIGYILVFSFVLIAVSLVTVGGMTALQSVQDAQQTENAVTAMDILSDNIKDVYARGAPSRATEINLNNGNLAMDSGIDLSMTLRDTGGVATPKSKSWTIRPIVYTGPTDTQIIYEAGATYRVEQEGSVSIEDPPFIVEGTASGDPERIHIPVVATQISESASVGGSTALVRTGTEATSTPQMWHYNADNTVGSYDELELQVDSPRHELWSAYLTDEGFSCSTSGTVVTCTITDNGGDADLDAVSIVVHEIPVTIEI
jgi:hypothetical protein